MASFSKCSDGGIQLSNDCLSVIIYPKYGGKNLWVIHPALRIGPHIRFHFPSGEVIVEDEIGGRVPKGTSGFRWPGTDIGVDLSYVPEKTNAMESYYIVNLAVDFL